MLTADDDAYVNFRLRAPQTRARDRLPNMPSSNERKKFVDNGRNNDANVHARRTRTTSYAKGKRLEGARARARAIDNTREQNTRELCCESRETVFASYIFSPNIIDARTSDGPLLRSTYSRRMCCCEILRATRARSSMVSLPFFIRFTRQRFRRTRCS